MVILVMKNKWRSCEERARTAFLPNLEPSHCQPVYETNSSIRSHPYRIGTYLLYRVFPKPVGQWQF
jgi:hypothetical protein